MATVTLQGNEITTVGQLPSIGSTAPDFTLVAQDLSDIKLSDYQGKRVVLNIFPSIDTGTCQASVRAFNSQASQLDNTVILCISADLPFAQARFCGAEGLDKVITASTFRSPSFGQEYGVTFDSGPLSGLLSRSVVIIDTDGKVLYQQQVDETVDEPDYDAALAVL